VTAAVAVAVVAKRQLYIVCRLPKNRYKHHRTADEYYCTQVVVLVAATICSDSVVALIVLALVLCQCDDVHVEQPLLAEKILTSLDTACVCTEHVCIMCTM
jgi:hypothetical protein